MALTKDQQKIIANLEKLGRFGLDAAINPVIEKYTEWWKVKSEIHTLENKRREVEEEGKKAVDEYNRALYKLLLRKIHESGKVYCEADNHVVSEVTTELVFNINCSQYDLQNVCSRCLNAIKAGEIVHGARHILYETKVEDGIRMMFKDGIWKPVPKDYFYDTTSEDYGGWLEDKLLKDYGLPEQLKMHYYGQMFP